MTEEERQNTAETLKQQGEDTSPITYATIDVLTAAEEMKRDAAIYAITGVSPYSLQPFKQFQIANSQTPEEYKEGYKQALDAYNSSCKKKLNFKAHVGNWVEESFHKEFRSKYDKEAKKHRKKLTQRIIEPSQTPSTPSFPEIKTEHLAAEYGGITSQTGQITINIFSSADKETFEKKGKEAVAQGLVQEKDYNELLDTVSNSPIKQYQTLYHEKTHSDHLLYDAMLKTELASPVNAIKCNILTEKTAKAAEYLSIANLYNTLKQKGLKTIQINGENRPLENILNAYPRLKEIIQTEGFSPNNPQNIRHIIQAATDYWHKNYENAYIRQGIKITETFAKDQTWSEKLAGLEHADELYQTTSSLMLKDIDIGQNTLVDLSACRDLLDTFSSEDAKKILSKNNISTITYEEMKEVNTYLEQNGIKTDEEKRAYMADFLTNATQRNQENIDQNLLAIIKKHNSNIFYTDNLQEINHNGHTIIITDSKFYDLSEPPPNLNLTSEKTASTPLSQNKTDETDLSLLRMHQNLGR